MDVSCVAGLRPRPQPCATIALKAVPVRLAQEGGALSHPSAEASEGARDFDFSPLFAVLTARFLREVLNGTAEAVPPPKDAVGTAFAVPLISAVKAAAFGDVSEGARDFDFSPLLRC
jgi:hypothetical protein